MAEPQTGRIGGGVLRDNLLRQGVDLNFKNTSSDTALLHLDVNNAKIGVNTETATDALTVPTILSTENLISTYANIGPNLTIDQSQIVAVGGDGFINFNATNNIFATAIATDDLKIDFNTISTTTTDTNIELRPNGNGTVNINSNWDIVGNLHATGNIQTTGNLTLGDNDDDNVTFVSDVNSDIIPDQTNTVSLGSPSKQWLNIYSESVIGQIAELDNLNLAGLSLSRRQGNIFYVSTLGNDTNAGDHPNGSFRTLKHALAQVDGSTSGPTAIHVFPGEYEEEFPLTVPSHTDIVGEDTRNVIIKPTPATQSNSAFYLEDDVTIENLTIKDFYTGYAFQFTAGGLVSTRSPYIRNVAVITKGSVTSASDPRGFDQGDAGKGALIDGSVLDSASLEASMLFHSCTFITPGVDAITMTNGVRVEWLNSFTYFANRGLYATQGVTGKLMPDSSIRYGAEVRSIGSACVYGNYGAVADGANTLMYLIGHNFAYIGTGKDTSNDNTLSIASQSVTELNSGTIVHTSTDQTGKFSVGDSFFVDFETGETSIDANEVDFSGISAININNGVDQTYIDGERVDTGNIRFTGNNVETLTGPLDIASANNNINFLKDTNLDGNIEMSGNFSISGELINVGNEITDTVEFNTEFIRDVIPDISGRYNLGSSTKIWSKAWLSQAQISDIKIQDNVVTTTESNADLELRANGTGNIYFPNNNLQIDNDLTVVGNTSLQNVSDSQPDSISLLHTLDNPNAFGTSFQDLFGVSVAISGNYAIVGASLEDEASGTTSGKAYIFNVTTGALLHTLDNPNAFDTTAGDLFGGTLAISGDHAIVGVPSEDDAGGTSSGKAYIFDVTTGTLVHTLDNPNPFGTSESDIFGSNVGISGNYAIVGARLEDEASGTSSGKAYIFDVTTGNLLHTLDNPNAFGTIENDQFGNSVAIDGNYAIVSSTGEDDAGGTSSGKAYIFDVTTGNLLHTLDNPNAFGTSVTDQFGSSVAISGNRAIVAAISEDDTGGTSSGKAYIFDVTSGSLLHTLDNPNAFGTSVDDVFGSRVGISGNYAIVGARREDSDGVTNSGKAYIFDVTTGDLIYTIDNPNPFDETPRFNLFGQSVAISGNRAIVGSREGDPERESGRAYIFNIVDEIEQVTIPVDVNITGTLTHVGDRNQLGDKIVTGNATITQDLDVTRSAQFEEILIDDNVVTTTSSNADLELRASGTGTVVVPNNDVIIENNLTVNDVNANNVNVQDNITSNELSASNDIFIRDNFIETTSLNSDLVFGANGTGKVLTPNPVNISSNINVDNNMSFTGNLSGDDILSVTNLTAASTFNAEIFDISGQIIIQDNFITTTESNSDLDLRAAGTGSTTLNNIFINANTLGTTLDSLPLRLAPTENLILTSTSALQIPVGTTAQRVEAPADEVDEFLDGGVALNSGNILDGGNANTIFGSGDIIYNSGGAILVRAGNVGEIRFNTDDAVFEGTSNETITFGGVYSSDRQTSVTADPNSNNIRFIVEGAENPLDSASLVGEVTGSGLSIHGVQVDDISINNNIISPTADLDLILDSSITNELDIDNISIIGNSINNLSIDSSNIVFKQTGFGKSKVSGTFGVVIPSGTTAQQPEDSTPPEVGDTRWNTDNTVLETWDGDQYVVAAGTADAIGPAEFDNLLLEYTLALG